MVCGFCQGTALRDSGGTGRSPLEALGSALGRHGGGASQVILPTDQGKGIALPRDMENVLFPLGESSLTIIQGKRPMESSRDVP